MSTRASVNGMGIRDGLPRTGRSVHVVAVIEVVLAFAFVHVAYRAIKHFTGLGRLEGAAHLNFTPGAVMILFTICVVRLHGKNFSEFGLGLARLSENLKVGLLWGVLLVAGAGLLMLLGVRHQPGVRPPTMTEGVIYGVGSFAVVVFFAYCLVSCTHSIPWTTSTVTLRSPGDLELRVQGRACCLDACGRAPAILWPERLHMPSWTFWSSYLVSLLRRDGAQPSTERISISRQPLLSVGDSRNFLRGRLRGRRRIQQGGISCRNESN